MHARQPDAAKSRTASLVLGVEMTKKKKVAELERNIERVFLEFSIVVFIVVVIGMLIGARMFP